MAGKAQGLIKRNVEGGRREGRRYPLERVDEVDGKLVLIVADMMEGNMQAEAVFRAGGFYAPSDDRSRGGIRKEGEEEFEDQRSGTG